MPHMATFGERFDALIRQIGLSRSELGFDVRIDSSTITSIIKGKRRPNTYIKAIAKHPKIAETVSEEELWAWVIIEEFSKEAIKIAAEELNK